MGINVTGIGPLHAQTRLEGTHQAALIVAVRWQDAEADRISHYLAKVAGGSPNELVWIKPEDVVSIRM
jgi:hypothetical protein